MNNLKLTNDVRKANYYVKNYAKKVFDLFNFCSYDFNTYNQDPLQRDLEDSLQKPVFIDDYVIQDGHSNVYEQFDIYSSSCFDLVKNDRLARIRKPYSFGFAQEKEYEVLYSKNDDVKTIVEKHAPDLQADFTYIDYSGMVLTFCDDYEAKKVKQLDEIKKW